MKKSNTEALFDQAADTFVNAFKTCVHLQEDTARKCFDLVKGWGEADDWTKHYQKFVDQTMPSLTEASEQSMTLWKKNAEKCMELLQAGFAATPATSPSEAQTRLQKLWEESLKSMKENTEAVVKMSSEAMKGYADFMKERTPEPVGK